MEQRPTTAFGTTVLVTGLVTVLFAAFAVGPAVPAPLAASPASSSASSADAAADPHGAAPGGPGDIGALVLAHVGGDPAAPITVTTWGMDGPTERTVTAGELVTQLEATSLGGLGAVQAAGDAAQDGPTDDRATDRSTATAEGDLLPVQVGVAGGWPFCDVASSFILHDGAPGDAVTNALPVAPAGGTICGGGFGPALYYADITVDRDPAEGVTMFCGAAKHWIEGEMDEEVTATGGYICNAPRGDTDFRAASLHGRAALFSADLGPFTLDFALGGGNLLTLGDPV